MENFLGCIVVSGIVTFIVNLAMARYARDKQLAELARMFLTGERVTAKEVQGRKVAAAIVDVACREEKSVALRGALKRMGWKAGDVDRCVASLGKRVETEELSTLVKDAIVALAN